MMSFGIIGVSVRGGNLPLLESLVVPEPERAARLSELKTFCNFIELVPVYTCNRSEYYYLTLERPAGLEFRNRLLDFFLRDKQVQFEPSDITSLVAFRALRHLYRVTASLDSLVVGEAQILGQVKTAVAQSEAMGLSGPRMANIFSDAFRVSKKIRRETPLGQYSVSMVNLVLDTIIAHLDGQNDPSIALVGVGPMSVKLAGHLKDRGLTNFVFVNRTESKAEGLVAQFGGKAQSLETFLSGPTQVDVVFSATGAPEPVFTPDVMCNISSSSDQLLMIDLAIPRDVDPSVAWREDIRVVDIAHFRAQAEENRRERFRAVDAAERIIDQAIGRAHMQNAQRAFQPVMASALNEGLAYAEAQMRRLFETRLSHLTATDREAVAHFVRQLVQYNNHLPMEALAHHTDISREDCSLLAGFDCVEERCEADDHEHPAANRCAMRETGVCLGKVGRDLDAL
jgi:glutamyl-tRNA reductase